MAEADSKYFAEAFECDEQNKKVASTEAKLAGSSVRICVRPTQLTRERGVVMRRIDSFVFQKSEFGYAQVQNNDAIIQHAITRGGKEGEGTLVTCDTRYALCVFRTKLNSDFYLKDGEVVGSGLAVLEFEKKESESVFGVRHLRHRDLQEAEASDLYYAGKFPVQLSFPVARSADTSALAEAQHIWEGMSGGTKYGIIGGVLLVFICFLLSIMYCCLRMFKRDREMTKKVDGTFPREVHVNPKASFFDLFRSFRDFGYQSNDITADIDGDSVCNIGKIPSRFSPKRASVAPTSVAGITPLDAANSSDVEENSLSDDNSTFAGGSVTQVPLKYDDSAAESRTVEGRDKALNSQSNCPERNEKDDNEGNRPSSVHRKGKKSLKKSPVRAKGKKKKKKGAKKDQTPTELEKRANPQSPTLERQQVETSIPSFTAQEKLEENRHSIPLASIKTEDWPSDDEMSQDQLQDLTMTSNSLHIEDWTSDEESTL
mmetsp:Transcript_9918/g.18093  ORF Transcript_9918/g.18093 Transcript_9918/m.18093 type:complete len:486 (+) Transcript_9918:117-1574(+)